MATGKNLTKCWLGRLSKRRWRRAGALAVLAVLAFSAAWFLPGESTVRAGWYNVVPPWSATGLSIDSIGDADSFYFQVEVGDVVYAEVAAAGSKCVGFKLYAPGHGGPYWGTPWYSGEMLRYTADAGGRCELIVEGSWGLANTWPPVYYSLVIKVTPGPTTTTTTTRPTTTTTTTATTTLPTTTTTTTAPPGSTFSDVPTWHPYSAQINAVAALGIVSGYGNGTFGPNSPVIRQQFAKMIVKTLGFEVTGYESCPFSDVGRGMDPADPFYPDHYVAVCAARGITEGKAPSVFGPYDNITRQQLITMLVRAANLSDPHANYTPPFTPGQFYPAEHYQNARRAAFVGLLDGLDGIGPKYGFQNPATRGEVCVLLYNLLYR